MFLSPVCCSQLIYDIRVGPDHTGLMLGDLFGFTARVVAL